MTKRTRDRCIPKVKRSRTTVKELLTKCTRDREQTCATTNNRKPSVASNEFSLRITLVYFLHLTGQILCTPTKFVSHVRVTTPAHSYMHGVGDPIPELGRSSRQRQSLSPLGRELRKKIPLLPLSPYKVDSADPESLWPVGLFIPPLKPTRLQIQRRSNEEDYLNPGYNRDELNAMDPYLLQGSKAVTAVVKAKHHGELYFDDIPHIQSLLSNQELRIKNHLKPHRLGSIRQTWSYNRL